MLTLTQGCPVSEPCFAFGAAADGRGGAVAGKGTRIGRSCTRYILAGLFSLVISLFVLRGCVCLKRICDKFLLVQDKEIEQLKAQLPKP